MACVSAQSSRLTRHLPICPDWVKALGAIAPASSDGDKMEFRISAAHQLCPVVVLGRTHKLSTDHIQSPAYPGRTPSLPSPKTPGDPVVDHLLSALALNEDPSPNQPLLCTLSRISLVELPSGSSRTSFALGISINQGRIVGWVRIFDIFPVSTLTDKIGWRIVNADRSRTRILGREGGRKVSSILGGGVGAIV